jgi:hypothetical protein
MLSAVYTNIFELFATQFAAVSSQYVIMSFIMQNMKWIVLSWLFVVSAVMFTRQTPEQRTIDYRGEM